MLLTLLLDFSAADARWLGGLLWKGAFLFWVPQLLMLAYVLSRRGKEANGLGKEILLLLVPLLLLVSGVASAPALALLVVLYSDVSWGLLLLGLGLPTLTGIVFLGATNVVRPAPRATPAPAPPAPRVLSWLLALVVVGAGAGLLSRCQFQPRAAPAPVLPFPDETRRRAEQARQDSLLFQQQWGEDQEQPAPPAW